MKKPEKELLKNPYRGDKMSRNSIGGEDFSQKESMEIPGLPAYNTGKGPAGPVLQRSLTSRFAGRD